MEEEDEESDEDITHDEGKSDDTLYYKYNYYTFLNFW